MIEYLMKLNKYQKGIIISLLILSLSLIGFMFNSNVRLGKLTDDIYDNTNISKKGFYKLNNGKIYQIRTGCWCCPQATRGGYLEWLSRYYPNYHKQLKYLWSK